MSVADVPPVGKTALLTATARLAESRRPDPLFVDPWAGPLLDAYRRADPAMDTFVERIENSELWEFFRLYFPGRTPFFDAAVLGGIAAGAAQVVILAAGFDARAARLDLPAGVPVYELDTAPVLEFKNRTLAGAGLDVDRRRPVPVDLAADWSPALRAAGHRPELPTVWLAEGLLFYLDAAACTRLAAAVRAASAPGSSLAVEYFGRLPAASDFASIDAADTQTLQVLVDLFDEGPPAPPQTWLPSLGVTVDRITDLAAELDAQGREMPFFVDPARADPFPILLASGTFSAATQG